jgi:hypothetical protein
MVFEISLTFWEQRLVQKLIDIFISAIWANLFILQMKRTKG